jgi:hypothetical protein
MIYYPLNKIKPNQYTNGGEYITIKDKTNYIGYYFSTFDNKFFTGKNVGDTTNIELQSIINTNNNNSYNFVGNKFYSQILMGKNKEIQNLPTFSIPTSPIIKPTEQEYQEGQFIRYFMKRSNGSIINEINKEIFDDIEQGVKYNKALYVTIQMKWKISGPLEDVINDNILIRGVKTTNYELIRQTNLIFMGINQYLTNYTEFYKS